MPSSPMATITPAPRVIPHAAREIEVRTGAIPISAPVVEIPLDWEVESFGAGTPATLGFPRHRNRAASLDAGHRGKISASWMAVALSAACRM